MPSSKLNEFFNVSEPTAFWRERISREKQLHPFHPLSKFRRNANNQTIREPSRSFYELRVKTHFKDSMDAAGRAKSLYGACCMSPVRRRLFSQPGIWVSDGLVTKRTDGVHYSKVDGEYRYI